MLTSLPVTPPAPDAPLPLGQLGALFGMAFVVTALVTPLVRRMAVAWQCFDRPDAGLKPHSRAVPYLGGVAMFIGWGTAVVSGVFYLDAGGPVIAGVILAATMLMLTGLIDDRRGLRPTTRIIMAIVAAGMLLYGGLGVGIYRWLGSVGPGPERWATLSVVLGGLTTVCLLLGIANATNLVDGMDGLCAGTALIAAAAFLVFSMLLDAKTAGYQPDAASLRLVMILAPAVAGAAAGFLVFNFNPASIFMGDSGSLLLGLNFTALILLCGEASSGRLIAGAIAIYGFPIFDTTLAIARRKLNRRPLMVGDRSHFYDQLSDRGFSVRQTVLICYGFGLFFALLGLAAIVLPGRALIGTYGLVIVLAVLLARQLGLLRVDDAADRSARKLVP